MASGFQLAREQAAAYESFTRVFMEGSARLLADGALIERGDVVLDLACGTGLVARHAVDLVAPGGRVVGADVNPAMLEIARSIDDVEWTQCPCDALAFDDGTFTHVICQQGFQFFPDAGAAMRETRRVLRPGGALIATVWATPGRTPYIEHQLDLFAELDPTVAASVRRATPANSDDFLASTADAAGFADIEISILEHDVDIADLDDWFLAQTGGTPWGPIVAALSDAGRRELTVAMTARMQPYARPEGGHRIPFRSFRLAARTP